MKRYKTILVALYTLNCIKDQPQGVTIRDEFTISKDLILDFLSKQLNITPKRVIINKVSDFYITIGNEITIGDYSFHYNIRLASSIKGLNDIDRITKPNPKDRMMIFKACAMIDNYRKRYNLI